MHGSLEISEPWDFPQVGEIRVVVLAAGADETLVRFETPVAYRSRTHVAARLHPRHEGRAFAPSTSPVPVNVVLLQDPAEAHDDAGDSGRDFLIGTFRYGSETMSK